MFPPGARSVLSPEVLEAIRTTLDDDGPVIVECAIDGGGGGRDWRMFEGYDDFLEYARTRKPADLIYVWAASKVLRSEDVLIWGKCPDADGNVPTGGAY